MDIYFSNKFKKDYKKLERDKRWDKVFKKSLPFSDKTAWKYVIDCFVNNEKIPNYFYPHPIKLPSSEIRSIKKVLGSEINIKAMDLHFDGRTGDCLLLYAFGKEKVYLIRMGSHSDLFK